jgi:prophage regulatory protein
MDRKQATPHPLEYWRIHRVSQVTGLGVSTVKKMVREKRFPPPVKLTPRTSTWRSDVVLQWGAERELLTKAGMAQNPSPWLKEAGKKAAEMKRRAKATPLPAAEDYAMTESSTMTSAARRARHKGGQTWRYPCSHASNR